MANEKVQSVILRITEDKASAARVQQLIDKTRANLKQMGEEAKKLPFPAVERGVEKAFDPEPVEQFNDRVKKSKEGLAGLGDEAGKTQQKVGSLLEAFRQTQKAQLPTGNELPEIGDITGKRAFNLSRLGSDIKALPAVPIPGTGLSTDVAGKALNILGRTGASLNDLALAAGAAAPALVAVGLAFAAFNVVIKQGEASVKASLTAQEKYYEDIKTLDSKGAEARKKELQTLLEEEQKKIDESQNALNKGFQSAIRDYGEIPGKLLFSIASKDVEASIEQSQAKFDAYYAEFTRLSQAQEEGTFAAVDARKAEEELAKARATAARTNIDRLISAQQEAAQLAADGTSDSLKSRLESLAIEKKVILDNLAAAEKLAATSGDNTQVDRLRTRLNDIDTLTNTILLGGVDQIIAAREAEAKAAEDASKKAEDLAKALEKVQDAQRKFADIQDTYDNKLSDISANLAKAASDKLAAIDKAIADAAASRADLIAKANDDLNEAEREAVKDREKLARDHAKAVQKILRDGNRDQQRAIEDRDAVALDRAQQAQQDALDDENSAYEDRTREIDARLSEQNRLVSKRLAEQLQEVDKRLREQTQVAIQRYNEQVQVANQQRQAALDNYNKQLSDLRYALNQDALIRANGYNNMLQSSQSFATGLTALASSVINQAAALRNAASGSIRRGGPQTPTPFANGIRNGLAPAFTDILVGEKEPEILRLPRPGAVFTPQQYMNAGGKSIGNISITVNANGLNEAQAKRVIKQTLVEVIG